VNVATAVGVDDAERDPSACVRLHASGPDALAAACAARGIRLVAFSSWLVFDGARLDPYLEHHDAAPLSVLGAALAEGELRVLAAHADAMVVRTGALFGHGDAGAFATRLLRALARSEEALSPTDVVVSPTYVPDLVEATLDLVIDGERGIWHLTNQGVVSWCEFAEMWAEEAGWDAGAIVRCTFSDLAYAAPRPAYGALASERALLLPALEDAVVRHART
jgi:dTDP-4-dehydrorhamnose reductase